VLTIQLSWIFFNQVKPLFLLPYEESMTTEMVAEYYEVGISAIKSLVFDNADEIYSDGYAVLEKDQLKSFKDLCHIKTRAKQIAISQRRAILRVGMLLKDSQVSKRIREALFGIFEDKGNQYKKSR
jgi:restriction system protein